MWNIAELTNTVKISEKCAEDLFKINPNCIWEDIEEITLECLLYFNTDHYESMDFVSNKEVQKVLKKHKVEGEITFGSLDGDNFGEFWGYRFDGKGNMLELKGELSWKEIKK